MALTDKELLEKYKAFLISVELCRETTDKTFEEFKKDYLKSLETRDTQQKG